MLFNQVLGQSAVKKQLINMAAKDRLPHAQIFLGPEGCGKLALAIAIAQYTLCHNKQAEDSCGTCPACNKVSKLIHPDLHFSFPTIGSKAISTQFLKEWRTAVEENPYMNINQWLQCLDAENKQGNITKDECVQIVKKLSLKKFEGSYKILIMWLPEHLGKEGNRLLKLIEEPPEDTLFILVAENQEKILNTILSRCQLVKINRLEDEQISQALIRDYAQEETQAKQIAYLADGNFNESKILIENNKNDQAALFLSWMRISYKGNGAEMVKWVDEFAGIGRENQKHFLKYGLHFLREYMILKMTNQTNIRLQASELEAAQKLSKIIDFYQIEEISKLFNNSAYYIERNANPKALFLDASIQLNKILKPIAVPA